MFMDAVVFDTETTGMSPQRGARIIELGAVRIFQNEIVEEFHSLINVAAPISPYAQKVHGISKAMLRGQPEPEEVYPQFNRFIANSTLVAHNAKFDMRFIAAEFARIGLDMSHASECTLRLSRIYLPELANHKLETVYRHLGGVIDDNMKQHRALDDARMAAYVWLALCDMRAGRGR